MYLISKAKGAMPRHDKADDDDNSSESSSSDDRGDSSSSNRHRRHRSRERRGRKSKSKDSKTKRKRRRTESSSLSRKGLGDGGSSRGTRSDEDDNPSYDSSDSSSGHRRKRRRHDKSKKKKKSSKKDSKKAKKRSKKRKSSVDSSDSDLMCDHLAEKDKSGNPLKVDSQASSEIHAPQDNKSSKEDHQVASVPEEKQTKRAMMAPMSKEQYEKQQSTVREVYDEESGRRRLVRGSGEIIERIVSRDDHQRINQRATQGDGSSFSRHIFGKLQRR